MLWKASGERQRITRSAVEYLRNKLSFQWRGVGEGRAGEGGGIRNGEGKGGEERRGERRGRRDTQRKQN